MSTSHRAQRGGWWQGRAAPQSQGCIRKGPDTPSPICGPSLRPSCSLRFPSCPPPTSFLTDSNGSDPFRQPAPTTFPAAPETLALDPSPSRHPLRALLCFTTWRVPGPSLQPARDALEPGRGEECRGTSPRARLQSLVPNHGRELSSRVYGGPALVPTPVTWNPNLGIRTGVHWCKSHML